MDLEIYRHLWGVEAPFEEAVPRIKEEGYAGIEHDLPTPADQEGFSELLSGAGLQYIADIYSEGETPDDHATSLSEQVHQAASLGATLINSHTGADSWSQDDCSWLFEQALSLEAEVGIPIAHETHRGRALFNPWRAHELLARLPELRLCCDYSHWVVVAERLIDEETEVRAACAERCIHIHARVGYEQGAQVPDPAAPEYEEELAAHERWWDEIWDAQQSRGLDTSTLTPEYGPPLYLHTLPYTNVPVADLWQVCLWQASRERARFAAREDS
jgi:hypothetical protein